MLTGHVRSCIRLSMEIKTYKSGLSCNSRHALAASSYISTCQLLPSVKL